MPIRKYLDTSAEVKLYVGEPETQAIQAEVDACDEVLISRLTLLEFRSALYGMVRQGRKPAADMDDVVRLFDADLPNLTIVPVDEAVFRRAQALLDTGAVSANLRPLDALQLAGALEEHARNPIDAVVTTDQVQVRVARANGLTVVP